MDFAVRADGATRIVLVRHGEGHVNVDRVWGGLRGCTGLTDNGRKQAAALRDRWMQSQFHPDVLIHSPVRRARETAEIIVPALGSPTVREDCALCEIHLGEADGLSWEAYDFRYGRPVDLLSEPERPFAPGAESWAEIVRRVRRCLSALAAEHVDQTVVVVTHAGFIYAAVLSLLAIPATGERADLDPWFTSLTWCEHADNRWTLLAFNDVGHLSALPGVALS